LTVSDAVRKSGVGRVVEGWLDRVDRQVIGLDDTAEKTAEPDVDVGGGVADDDLFGAATAAHGGAQQSSNLDVVVGE
jgi:hypothetical protein